MRLHVDQLANNQIVVIDDNGKHFFSYGHYIATRFKGVLTLSERWNQRPSTLKWLKSAYGLSMTKKQIEQQINDGLIKIKGE